jgi:hypothetical protein
VSGELVTFLGIPRWVETRTQPIAIEGVIGYPLGAI